DRDGNRIGAYQFAYDVSERRRNEERLRHTEAALRQAQKMESLGQLTGGVALIERNPPSAARVLETMRRAISRGTGLTRQLLAFSRRQPLNPESIDLAAHLGGMRSMLDSALGGHIDVEMT